MKKIILLLLITFQFLANANSQVVKLYITESGEFNNRLDSVLVGFDNQATLDIDPALGEENVHSEPMTGFGIKSIQRTSNDFLCSYGDQSGTFEIHYPTNIDTKVNLRSPDDLSIENRTFEFLVYHDSFFHADVWIVGPSGTPIIEALEMILISSDTCNSIPIYDYYPFMESNLPNASGFAAGTLSTHSILIRFKEGIITSNSALIIPDKKIRVYPTIFKNELHIESNYSLELMKVRLIRSSGEIVYSDLVENVNAQKIDVSKLNQGMYFLQILDDERIIKTQKLVKLD